MTELKHLVFLSGFMGSGKSTIGPLLAREIRYGFVDVDDTIEKGEGLPIRDIFKERGEKHFRAVEERTLKQIVQRERNMVIALGGGALGSEVNRTLVRDSGILVYLKSDAEKIIGRVRRRSTRPMLLSPGGEPLTDEELLLRVRTLLREREKHYLEASIIVNTSQLNIPESVEEIVLKLRGKIL